MAVATETEPSLEESLRAGLPPVTAPGLERIALDLARFAAGQVCVADFIAAVDLIGEELQADIQSRMREAAGAELQALRSSWAWLARFPSWGPTWR